MRNLLRGGGGTVTDDEWREDDEVPDLLSDDDAVDLSGGDSGGSSGVEFGGYEIGISDDWTSTDDAGDSLTDATTNTLSAGWSAADSGLRSANEAVLDNENFSVQEGYQNVLGETAEGMAWAASGGEFDEEITNEEVSEGVTWGIQNARSGIDDAVSGTRADNRVTRGAAWLGEAVFVDPAAGVFEGATGIETENSGTEATAGADTALDVALSSTGIGAVGKAAKAARSGDRVRDVFNTGSSAADEAAQATNPDPNVTFLQEAESPRTWLDDAISLGDEGGQTADEAGETFTYADETSGSSDTFAFTGDDRGQVDQLSLTGRVRTDLDDAPSYSSPETRGPVNRIRNLLGGGDDVPTGSDESRDLFNRALDDGLTSAADDAAQGADEGSSFFDDLTSGTDPERMDVSQTASTAADDVPRLPGRTADETAQTVDESEDAASVFENAAQAADDGPGFNFVDDTASPRFSSTGSGFDEAADSTFNRVADNLGSTADDAAQGADEAGRGGRLFDEGADSTFNNVADDLGRGIDEPAQAGNGGSIYDNLLGGTDNAADDGGSLWDDLLSRGSDDAARGADDAARGADEGAGLVDEGGQAADESGGLLDRLFGTPKRAAGTTGAAVLGGSLLGSDVDDLVMPDNPPQNVTVTDENGNTHQLALADQLPPVEKFPTDGAAVYAVVENAENQGYWVMLGMAGRNIYALTANGEATTAKIDIEDWRELGGEAAIEAAEEQANEQAQDNGGVF